MNPSASHHDLKMSNSLVNDWHRRLKPATAPTFNALTIDVEDYFQVEAFFGVIDRASWDTLECRVERNVELIIRMLSESGSKATFFTLGWIARRYPQLIKNIVAEGHELASHGSEHRRADNQTREEFLVDLIRSKHVLEDIGGKEVKGYRAPSFSILEKNLWALEQIEVAGYRYSSSIYPVTHDNYGIPAAPRFAFYPFAGSSFLEVPVTSLRVRGRNFPCGGGGFFRLLPYRVNAAALRAINQKEKEACVFYFHPWELDQGQPRVKAAGAKSKFRHYLNLHRMEPRLRRLFSDFDWRSMEEVFLNEKKAP